VYQQLLKEHCSCILGRRFRGYQQLLKEHYSCVLIRGFRGYQQLLRINYTKPPSSGAGNVSEPSLMSQVGRVREVVCA